MTETVLGTEVKLKDNRRVWLGMLDDCYVMRFKILDKSKPRKEQVKKTYLKLSANAMAALFDLYEQKKPMTELREMIWTVTETTANPNNSK